MWDFIRKEYRVAVVQRKMTANMMKVLGGLTYEDWLKILNCFILFRMIVDIIITNKMIKQSES